MWINIWYIFYIDKIALKTTKYTVDTTKTSHTKTNSGTRNLNSWFVYVALVYLALVWCGQEGMSYLEESRERNADRLKVADRTLNESHVDRQRCQNRIRDGMVLLPLSHQIPHKHCLQTYSHVNLKMNTLESTVQISCSSSTVSANVFYFSLF